jgi:4-hydroxy-tetrahydrodipicolinate reductase
MLADLLNCKNITSIRSKDVIGTHEVILISDDEVINIKHTITSRNNFINGVLKAVEYLKGKEVGLYDMEDIVDAM